MDATVEIVTFGRVAIMVEVTIELMVITFILFCRSFIVLVFDWERFSNHVFQGSLFFYQLFANGFFTLFQERPIIQLCMAYSRSMLFLQ